MGLSAGRPGPDHRLVAAAGTLAAVLFIALFRLRRLGPLDFWAWLAANVIIVVAAAFFIDRGYAGRLRDDLRADFVRKAAIGALSAAALYGVFAAGRLLALRLFPFAEDGIASVYALKAGVAPLRVVLLIALVIGPGEELFWRGFFQVAGLLYTAVHLASGNIMLVLAAAVCGLFWGWLYLRFRSPLTNIISHTLWDLAVFVFLPF